MWPMRAYHVYVWACEGWVEVAGPHPIGVLRRGRGERQLPPPCRITVELQLEEGEEIVRRKATKRGALQEVAERGGTPGAEMSDSVVRGPEGKRAGAQLPDTSREHAMHGCVLAWACAVICEATRSALRACRAAPIRG